MSEHEVVGSRQTQFLANLAQAMRTSAEKSSRATVDQCESDAKAYTQHLRARKNGDTSSLHAAADADVEAIGDWSKAESERIGREMEDRISRRKGLLDEELQDYRSAVDIELERVGGRVRAFEAVATQFFERIMVGTDPATFAAMAAQLPVSPPFGEPDPVTLVRDLRLSRSPLAQADSVPIPEPAPVEVQDHWWMDSPSALAARVRAKADARDRS
jgi:hypothetical protein